MTKQVNTWVRFTYVDVVKKPPSMICVVEGCGKPRHPMGERFFRTRCREHYAEWQKAYLEHKALMKK